MNYDFEESGKRDHVNINDFDVLNRISSIINSEFGSNDAAIARYLVAHIRRSSEINVAAITRDAFVTVPLFVVSAIDWATSLLAI